MPESISLETLIKDASKLTVHPQFRHLGAYNRYRNVFHVLCPGEIYHSRFIAWLLDPSQGHGLGSRFLREFLLLARESAEAWQDEQPGKNALAGFWDEWGLVDIDSWHLDDTMVLTETRLTDGAENQESALVADILLVNIYHEWSVAIEVKTGANYGDNQLDRYSSWASNDIEGPNYDKAVILLDIDEQFEGEEDETTQSPNHCLKGHSGYFSPSGFEPIFGILDRLITQEAISDDISLTIKQWIDHMEDTDTSYDHVTDDLTPIRTQLRTDCRDEIERLNRSSSIYAPWQKQFSDLPDSKTKDIERIYTLMRFYQQYGDTLELLAQSRTFEGVMIDRPDLKEIESVSNRATLHIYPKELSEIAMKLKGHAWLTYELDHIDKEDEHVRRNPDTVKDPGPGKLFLWVNLPEAHWQATDRSTHSWEDFLGSVYKKNKDIDRITTVENNKQTRRLVDRWNGLNNHGTTFPEWLEDRIKKVTNFTKQH